MPFKSDKQKRFMWANHPDIAKRWEEYQKGGKLSGPSHDKGGIPIEVEGGEYVVKKDSVNRNTEKVLEYINKYGSIPNKLELGGLIRDARKRRK